MWCKQYQNTWYKLIKLLKKIILIKACCGFFMIFVLIYIKPTCMLKVDGTPVDISVG